MQKIKSKSDYLSQNVKKLKRITMTKKTKTVRIGQFDYAKVSDRITEFRQDCPRGSIETTPTMQEGGQVMFRAHIIKDTAEEHTATATGHALSTEVQGKKDKLFEKTETIAVGRALALLGYGASGEIASSEEMQEFQEYRNEKLQEEIEDYRERLSQVKTLEQLKDGWAIMPIQVKQALQDYKEELKVNLSATKTTKKNENNTVSRKRTMAGSTQG